MKTEYEKLKEICDKIGYQENSEPFGFKCVDMYDKIIICDVREIIFTKKFINKYYEFYKKKFHLSNSDNSIMDLTHFEDFRKIQFTQNLIFTHLDDPVDYLYRCL
jgi:hypothetical protein